MRNVCKRVSFFLVVFLIASFLLSGCVKEEGMTMRKSISPIIDQEGADPFVIKHGDLYYYTKTTGKNITLYRSDTLTGISAGESCVLYEPLSELENLWAPEVFYLDNVWYVYFAANIPGDEMHHMYVLINENSDPFEGEWKCKPVVGMDDKFAIDGTVLELESGRYFIWSGWEGYENVQQDIYLAEMVSPTEVLNEKILLSSPEYEWEKQGNPLINEGPEIIIKGNTINLVYSASGSWTDDYCLGLLTANINDDIKRPESWEKRATPILNSGNDVYGPGHNCFTVSPDETETILIYHAARWQGAGWSRSVRFGYVEFDESGSIKQMQPIASEQLVQLPSGSNERQVYLTELFQINGNIEMKEDSGSISDYVLEGFLDIRDNVVINLRSEKKREAVVHVFAKVAEFSGDSDVTGIQIEVNGEAYSKPLYPSAYFQPVSMKVKLEKGMNAVIISSDTGGYTIAIDRIEIE